MDSIHFIVLRIKYHVILLYFLSSQSSLLPLVCYIVVLSQISSLCTHSSSLPMRSGFSVPNYNYRNREQKSVHRLFRKHAKTATYKQACSGCLLRAFTRLSRCLRVNYSIIVATRPDPTVRPPSRFYLFVIYDFLLIFLWFSISYFQYFAKLSLLLKFLEPL